MDLTTVEKLSSLGNEQTPNSACHLKERLSECELNDCSRSQKTETCIPPDCFEGSLNSQLPYNAAMSKDALDLSVHVNRCERSIFDDAEYFARNYMYKLMPITLEAVDETIIQIEHNYCHWGTGDPSNDGYADAVDVQEKNYKWRRGSTAEVASECDGDSSVTYPGSKRDELASNADEDYSTSVQPLDLSCPLLQEQKTDSKMLKENQSNIPKPRCELRSSPDVKEFDTNESNKENVTGATRKIEVTISRPGQKEYYQPCEVFLNDVARISPDLIKNGCYEIDIIDRTHIRDLESEKCRTYYIVAESTWRMFEDSTERIILTNDLNIGRPVEKEDRFGKPTYFIFDQYSLTESLAMICERKGGRFEYTCLEESKEMISKREQGCDNEDKSGHVKESCDEVSVAKVADDCGEVNRSRKRRRGNADGREDGEDNSRITRSCTAKRILAKKQENPFPDMPAAPKPSQNTKTGERKEKAEVKKSVAVVRTIHTRSFTTRSKRVRKTTEKVLASAATAAKRRKKR